MYQKIPRNLETSVKIMGLTPVELATCAVFYAFSSSLLRGIPFSFLLAIGLSLGLGGLLYFLNRSYPPFHGVYRLLQAFRKPVTPIMGFGKEVSE